MARLRDESLGHTRADRRDLSHRNVERNAAGFGFVQHLARKNLNNDIAAKLACGTLRFGRRWGARFARAPDAEALEQRLALRFVERAGPKQRADVAADFCDARWLAACRES